MTPHPRARTVSLALGFVLSLVLAGTALVAQAGGGGVPPVEQYRGYHPCRFDIRRFCAKAEAGRATRECLLRHQSELTDACRRKLETEGRRERP
jgi:hypothetical protein